MDNELWLAWKARKKHEKRENRENIKNVKTVKTWKRENNENENCEITLSGRVGAQRAVVSTSLKNKTKSLKQSILH